MADPHNKARYGETWPQYKIDAYLEHLQPLRPYVALSGGWAWHFMSPVGHVELKHAHDHKDLDLMVPKAHVGIVLPIILGQGFKKVATKYDRLPSAEEFRRYEKVVDNGEHPPFRLTIDFFVKDVPVSMIDGWMVVRPELLVTYYSSIHSSKSCFAVVAAEKMIESGIDPMRRPELCEIPNA